MKNSDIINIQEMKLGESGHIHSLSGDDSVRARLRAMGLHEGRLVRKVSESAAKAPVVLEVMGSRVAIGNGMAIRIKVRIRKLTLLLTGNPNVGKSVVFSRLTGLDALSSNYPGTTVEYYQGTAWLAGERFHIVDVPGTYSLAPACAADDVACNMLSNGNSDLVINVIDATNLERNLFFTLQLIEKDFPVILLLNKWDIALMKGITIDLEALSVRLGATAVPFVAVTGEGLKELNGTVSAFLKGDFPKPPPVPPGDDDKWKLIGELSRSVQKITHRHPTFLEKLADLSIRPLTGIPVALGVLAAAFYSIRALGEGLISRTLEPLFYSAYMPLVNRLSQALSSCGLCRELITGTNPEVMKSFGVLTTGIYVPFVTVLPYIFSFYLVLAFLEDLGYLPRLAVLLDRSMHKMGLHGYGTIPIVLGMGCKVPAVLAARILETRRERVIAMSLTLLLAPCMPQSAMIFSLLAKFGVRYAAAVFLTIAAVGIFSGVLLNKIIKGEAPELFVEIPPYQLPNAKALMLKVWLRTRSFLVEAVPMIMLGILAINILDITGIMTAVSALIGPALTFLLGLPGETVPVMVLGFLRKDVSIAMLSPFNMGPGQLAVACVFLVLYLPCLATFLVIARESGIKDALKIAAIGFAAALAAAGTLNLLRVLI